MRDITTPQETTNKYFLGLLRKYSLDFVHFL